MHKLLIFSLLLQNCLTFLSAVDSKLGSNNNGRIVFPNEMNQVLTRIGKSDEKPKCQTNTNDGYCTDVTNYPTARIEQLMKQENLLFQSQFKIKIDVNVNVNVTTRMENVNTEYMCDSDTNLIFPKAADTIDDKNVLIVNTPEYQQAVRVVKCKNAGKKCHYTDSFPNGYTNTKCQQDYFNYKLIAYNEKDKFYPVIVNFACCCRCAVLV